MKNEKMLRAIGGIDDDMIEDAVIQPEQKKQSFLRTPAFRRAVAIAACCALVLGLMLFKPHSEGPGVSVDPGSLLPPSVQGDGQGIQINGLDQLSYYAAIRIIAGTPSPALQSSSGHRGIVLLNTGSGTDRAEDPPVPETTGPVEGAITTAPSVPPVDDGDLYYYALDPNEPFCVNKVSMFQIELTDENGFLASKLGLGIVDVVIAEDCIWGESLLTFRRSENFYSCLTNGWSLNQKTGGWTWDFSTHKYVEGFNIVKNFEQENHAFYIDMNAEGQAFQFICRGTQNGGEHPDQNVKVVSSTVISNQGQSFTVAELEEYFNTGNLPEGSTPPTQPQDPPASESPEYSHNVYCNGEYVFSLDSDGTFIFHHVSGQDVKYEKGTYVIREERLTFFFVKADDMIETVNCELTENGFIYKGSEYVKESTPGLNAKTPAEPSTPKRFAL